MLLRGTGVILTRGALVFSGLAGLRAAREKLSTRRPTLAVKIVRQPKKIALIGAPSSAAAFSLGSAKAPAALRSAGLVEKLQAAGFEVVDHGDCAQLLFADDE